MRRYGWVAVALLLLALWAWQQHAQAPTLDRIPAPVSQPLPGSVPRAHPEPLSRPAREISRWPAYLPGEALATLQRIERGGPHPYRQDGDIFQNRERRLPSRQRGYYREYTVETPGSRDRGARRIVAGGDPPVEYFYSGDHYRSFRRFEPTHAGARR